MKPGEFWTHENFIDVFVEVLRAEGPGFVIKWWNRGGTGKAYSIGAVEWFPFGKFRDGWKRYE